MSHNSPEVAVPPTNMGDWVDTGARTIGIIKLFPEDSKAIFSELLLNALNRCGTR